MIADAHVHAWRVWPYAADVPDPATRGSAETLLYELDRHGIGRALVVAARIGHEVGPAQANDDANDYVAAAVARHPDRLAAAVDVDSRWSPEHHRPGAADRLTAAVDRYGAPVVTHYLGAGDDGWLDSPGGREFAAAAVQARVALSLAAGPAWYPSLDRLAAAFPTLPIMLHHLGGLVLDRPGFAADRAALLALARHPGVVVKVSGFHYAESPSHAYPYARARAEILAPLRDAFGADRLAWGSDFPVCRPHLSYRQAVATVADHTPSWTVRERALVLGGTLDRLLRTTADRPAPT